jgi:hypothetical protein
MTLHITIQVAADDRGDAIRLIRDAALRVKEGRNSGEWQHCMGAIRIDVRDDDVDRLASRFPDNDPLPFREIPCGCGDSNCNDCAGAR